MSGDNNGAPLVQAKVRISGKVQGVYFRVSTQKVAEQLGITGWVCNLPDGDVQALFEGPKNAVEKIVSWCHQGPERAQVQNVNVEWGPYTGQFDRFSILRD